MFNQAQKLIRLKNRIFAQTPKKDFIFFNCIKILGLNLKNLKNH